MSNLDIALMRKAGSLLAEVSALLQQRVIPGVTSLDLDQIAEAEIHRRHSIPAFKGYRGYRHTLCVSVNDQVVHGIPSEVAFQPNDVVSVDLGLSYGGYFADMAFTVVLGTDLRSHELKMATEDALAAGIRAARPGNRTGDIGSVIQSMAAVLGVGNVHAFAGHGIGRALHERPTIPNHGRFGHGSLLVPGMCIAIEPMFTLGSPEVVVLDDKWTTVTKDHSLAAHAEHTILITDRGPEILTR